MNGMSPATLLAAWEQAAGQVPPQRALTLLAAACPDSDPQQWALAPIGERDRHLLALRERLFGTSLEALATCPACGERLELAFRTGDIAVPPGQACAEVTVHSGGYEVQCRAPDTADLLAAADVDDGRELLLRRCVTLARRHDGAVEPGDLPPEVLEALTEALAAADPQADTQLALTCPACAHQWSMAFDVLAYLWSEIEDWAPRMLRDVHELASAYGWSERDILAMSAARRRCYLEMAAGQRY